MDQQNQILTKRMQIIEAFNSLLKTYTYRQIKAVHIIRESKVSHQTFYRLFTDKDALTKSICFEDFSLFYLIHGNTANWKSIVIDILSVIQRKGTFYRRLLMDPVASEIIKETIREISSTYTGKSSSPATVSVWLCVLQDWAKLRFKDSVEEAYRKLLYNLPVCDVLSGSELDRAIARYEQFSLTDFKIL